MKRSRPFRIVDIGGIAAPAVVMARMAEDWALAERAARNYPNCPSLQLKWIEAVKVVRQTAGGWLLERPMSRIRS